MNSDDDTLAARGLARRSILIGAGALAVAGCGRSDEETDGAPAPTVMPPQATPAPAKIVTVLGDSITAGLGLPAADALPAQLEKALGASGLSVRVRAAGVSGDTTAGGLARVDFSVQDDTDLCVVALGGNDMLQGVDPSTVRANLQAIIDRLKARHIPVLLAGMRAPPQYGSYAADFDRVFTDLAKEDDVAAYPFLLQGVALDDRYNQPDGIHPNAAGVKVIVAGLAPVVTAELSKASIPVL
jgi:acyl-CoA thioesterase-1